MTAGKRRLGSAVRTLYFLVFLFSILQLLINGIDGLDWTVDKSTLRRAQWLDYYSVRILVGILCIIVAVHALRLYVQIEMVEDRAPPFEDYGANARPGGLKIDFICRLAVVSVISYKALSPPSGHAELALYLFILYSVLLLWAVLGVWLLRQGFQYIGLVLIGFVMSVFYLQMAAGYPLDYARPLFLTDEAYEKARELFPQVKMGAEFQVGISHVVAPGLLCFILLGVIILDGIKNRSHYCSFVRRAVFGESDVGQD